MDDVTFIIGAPRSGTTMLMHSLFSHQDFAWISNWQNRIPTLPFLSVFNRAYDMPLVEAKLLNSRAKYKLLPSPAESWSFWSNYLENFRWQNSRKIPRLHTPNDMTSEEIRVTRTVVNQVSNYQKKSKFIAKHTDLPRVSYLREAFPDARFIHIIRDPRAVAASVLTKIERDLWDWWKNRDWWASAWPDEWRNEWQTKYYSELGMAAYQGKFFLDAIREDTQSLEPNRYLEIRYEKISESPEQSFSRIFDFCDVNFTGRVKKYLEINPVRNMNYKWRKSLSEDQQQIMHEIFAEPRFISLFHDA